MHRSVALVTALALALFAGVQLARTRDAVREAASAENAVADSKPSAASSVERDAATVDDANAEGASETSRNAVTDETESELTDELWIVDAATQAPLAGARVHHVDLGWSRLLEWYAGKLDLGERADWLQREATLHTSDARGLVRFPKSRQSGLAIVRHGELFGLWWIDEEHPKPWTLELLPDAHWDVRVRDERGAPIEGLLVKWSEKSGSLLAGVLTEEHGLARFEHARWRLAHAAEATFTVTPDAILRVPAAQEWDLREPPPAPTELVLPALGQVEVVLRDPDGEIWPHGANYVWVRDASGARGEQTEAKQQIAHWWSPPPEGSRVHAELGLDLAAGWRVQGAGGEVVVAARGPSKVGETVRIGLAAGIDAPLLRMRLLGPEGKPLADARVRVLMRGVVSPGGWGQEGEHFTDSSAFLRLPLSQSPDLHTLQLRFELGSDPDTQAAVTLHDPARRGWIELGDLRLQPSPVLVAGRVVDASGEPVSGAHVELEGTIGELEGAFDHGPTWDVLTDDQGAFELRSAEGVTRVKARTAAAQHERTPWVECEVGRTDLEIVIPSLAAIDGRLIFPEGVGPADFRVSVGGQWTDVDLRLDGSWKLEGVRPGPTTISVHDSSLIRREPLARADCLLAANARTRAPDIDLRGLRVIRLRVLDENGKPLDAYGAFSRPDEDDKNEISVSRGEARLLTRHARVDAWIFAAGYKSVRLEDAQDGAVLVLERGYPIRIRLRDAGVLPEFPFQLVAFLDGQLMTFDHLGTADFLSAYAGSRQVLIELRDTRAVHNVRQHLGANGTPLTCIVRVPESSEPSEIEIDVASQCVLDAMLRADGE